MVCGLGTWVVGDTRSRTSEVGAPVLRDKSGPPASRTPSRRCQGPALTGRRPKPRDHKSPRPRPSTNHRQRLSASACALFYGVTLSTDYSRVAAWRENAGWTEADPGTGYGSLPYPSEFVYSI